MIHRKLLIGFFLVVFLVHLGFANGSVENTRAQSWWDDSNTETYTGNFAMEDERFPLIETDDGERYYFFVPLWVDNENLPEVGDPITIEAFPSQRLPNHLVVVAAEVNGVKFDMDAERNGLRWTDERHLHGCGSFGEHGRRPYNGNNGFRRNPGDGPGRGDRRYK